MRSLVLLLALGLASSDKLDRTYLPPPGSKFSGGSPGAIDVPLEYPKETYSTTLRPLPGQNNVGLFPGDSQLSVGIDRGTGLPGFPGGSQEFGTLTPGQKAPFPNFQNSLNVPSTTTTYAFTQTTTFPTSEGFETTISPLDPSVSGFPIDNQQQIIGEGHFPQFSNQGQLVNNGTPLGFGRPGSQIGSQHSLPPYTGATRPIPGVKTYFDAPKPISHIQYLPAQPPSSTVSSISSIDNQSELVPQGQYQGSTQYIGVQPPTQFTGQRGTYPTTIVPQGTTGFGLNVPQQFQGQHFQRPIDSQGVTSTTVPSTYRPGISQYDTDLGTQGVGPQGSNVNQQQFGEHRPIQTINQSSIPSPSTNKVYQTSTSQTGIRKPLEQVSNIPQEPFDGQSQRPLQTVGPQVILPSTSRPQEFLTSNQQGISQYETGLDNIQDAVAPGSNISHQFDNQRLRQQGVLPSTAFPQGIPSIPGNPQYGINVQSTVAPGYNIPQTQLGQQFQTVQNGRLPNLQVNQPSVQNQYQTTGVRGPQQFPTTPKHDVFMEDSQNVFQPGSTASSLILPPGYSNLPGSSSTTPTGLPSYGTTASSSVYSTTPVYPGIQNEGNIPSSHYPHRLERPQAESDRNAVILNYDNVLTPDGFAYSFDTSNGIHADESGTATDGVKAQGSYSYTGDDGKVYSIVYSADENGFQPRGDHLPTPPPIPEAIQRVIEQAAKDKEAGISHDGSYDEDKYGHSKYQGPMNRYRPHSQDRIVTNGADIPDEYESQTDDVGNKKFGSQSGGRRPIGTNKDFINKYEEEIDEDGQYAGGDVRDNDKSKRPTNRIPSRRPSSKVSKQDIYGNDGNIIQTNRPTGSRYDITSGQKPSVIKDFSRHRPMMPGREYTRPSASTKYTGSVDDNEEILEETDGSDSESSHIMSEDNQRFPANRLPAKTTGNQYTEQETGSYNQPGVSNIRHQSTTGRPKGTKGPGSTSTIYSEVSDHEQNPNYNRNNRPLLPNGSPDTDNVETEDYYDQPGRYEQTVKERPKAMKRPGFSLTSKAQTGTTPLPGISVSQGEEYEYYRQNPRADTEFDRQGIRQPTFNPETMLRNNHPSRQEKPGSGYQYIPPQNKLQQSGANRYQSTEQGSTLRPFDEYETSDKKTTIHPFITPNVSTEDGNTYEDNSNQRFPLRKPGSTVDGVTTAPYPSEIGNEDNFETNNGPEYYDRQNSNKRIPPIQKPGKTSISSTRRPVYGQSQQPMGRPQYDEQYPAGQDRTTQTRLMRPGQNGRYPVDKYGNSEGRPRPGYYEQRVTPGHGFGSSSSEMPSQTGTSSVDPSGLYEQTNLSQYSTTPGTINEYPDKAGYATRRPGSKSRIPSTRPTSGPTYSDRTPSPLRPGSNTFDISTPGPVTEYDGIVSPGSSVTRPGTARPTYFGKPSVDYDRTVHSGSTTVRPGPRVPGIPGVSQIQNVPSTTYRPNYTFIDNSGQAEPTVDDFGRHISPAPSSGVPASSTYLPGYSVTSTTGLPAVESNRGRQQTHSPGIDGIPDDFKPNVQGSRDQGLRPTQGQGSRQPYGGQSSTERIIGEDFRGPKQPQRFDPQTGYHY